MNKANRLPTQKEIARLAGVSQVTVNAVLNGSNHTRTKPETRDHILAIAKELNYKIQRHARLMRTGKSGAIALVSTAGIVEAGYLRLNLASLAVRDAGYFPKIYDINWTGGDFEQTWDEMLQERPEGVLLVGGVALLSPRIKSRILKAEVPIVSLSGPHLEAIPLLIPDYREGFRRLTLHLADTGCRRLTLVMRNVTTYQKAYHWQDERRLGFLDAAKERAIKSSVVDLAIHRPEGEDKAALVFTDPQLGDSYRYGYDFARERIANGKLKEDGWLFFNDSWAQGALRALGEAKIPVPEALSLTGSDGDQSARYGYIPLTTLVQPIRRLVLEGAELLMTMIRDGQMRKNFVLRLPCELRMGATTTPRE